MGITLLLLTVFLPLLRASVHEYRLIQDLKENYDYFERPVANNSEPLQIKDEKNQVMTVMAWLQYNWTDYKLRWDPSSYGGLMDIRFSGHKEAGMKVWRPDILLFNSAAKTFDSTFSSNFVVKYTGEVIQNPPGILKFSCNIDITWFPFDDQLCFLKFGSWTYSGEFIDLDMDLSGIDSINDTVHSSTPIRDKDNPQNYFVYNSIDRTYYILNGEWALLNTPGLRVVREFDGSPYHELFFYIRIRRLTLAYGINLIIPSLLISVMTVLGFTLPPESCEKITLAAFFFCCLMVVSASVVFTVLVLNLHQRKPETHQMGPITRYLLLEVLPYLIMLKRPMQKETRKYLSQGRNTLLPLELQKNTSTGDEFSKLACTDLCKRLSNGKENFNEDKNPDLSEVRALKAIKKTVGEACRVLGVINRELVAMNVRLDEQHIDNQLEGDWRFAAMVVDRLCLYLFSTFIAISTSAILLPQFLSGAT